MGFKVEFNWILKIKDQEQLKNLKKGEARIFHKKEQRIYPVGIPIFLADGNLNCLGIVTVKKTIMSDAMEIETFIDDVFEGRKKEFLSNVLRETYG